MTGIEDWNILVNEEFLVSVVHHTTLITSLPFVHTARRSYRFECFGEFFGLDFFPEDQKVVQAITLRGRIRRNKVSVGEPADGSLLPFIQLARFRVRYVINIKKT